MSRMDSVTVVAAPEDMLSRAEASAELRAVMAGRMSIGDAILVAADLLAEVVGLATDDAAAANRALDALVPKIKEAMRINQAALAETRRLLDEAEGRA